MEKGGHFVGVLLNQHWSPVQTHLEKVIKEKAMTAKIPSYHAERHC